MVKAEAAGIYRTTNTEKQVFPSAGKASWPIPVSTHLHCASRGEVGAFRE